MLPPYTKKSVHSTLVTIASLRFIQCICDSKLPISPSSIHSYVSLIESSLDMNAETVQQAASQALGSVSARYDLAPYMQNWYGLLETKTGYILRRGWALAFGYLHLSSYNDIFSTLCTTIQNDVDIEVRRNAVKSIGSILSRVTNVQSITFLHLIVLTRFSIIADLDCFDSLFG